MKAEYRYGMQFIGWMALWWFCPLVALPLMLFFVARHFMALRKNRLQVQSAARMHMADERWARLEGFDGDATAALAETDPADWWKQ